MRLKTLAPSVATGADTLVACHGSVCVRLPQRQGVVAARRRQNYKAKSGTQVGGPRERERETNPISAVRPPLGIGRAGRCYWREYAHTLLT